MKEIYAILTIFHILIKLNKRSMGHTALLRNYDFHAIYKPEQSYDYTIGWFKVVSLKLTVTFNLNNIESHSSKDDCDVFKLVQWF